MSPNEAWARKVPSVYRKKILEENKINNAVYYHSPNEEMYYLAVIYKDYLDPNFNATCPKCYNTMMDVFRALLPEFIEIEKGEKLLNAK